MMVNNATPLMDLQVGWKFTKGRRVSQIQEATLREARATGKCGGAPMVLADPVRKHIYSARAFIYRFK